MNVVQQLLQFQSQLKLWHWMTKSFAQHEAFGDAYEAISGQIDEFIEVFFGRYGREALKDVNLGLKASVEDSTIITILTGMRNYFAGMDKDLKGATDLLALRDDMLGEVNHLVYRLSLV
jgi:hypothetical protein